MHDASCGNVDFDVSVSCGCADLAGQHGFIPNRGPVQGAIAAKSVTKGLRLVGNSDELV